MQKVSIVLLCQKSVSLYLPDEHSGLGSVGLPHPNCPFFENKSHQILACTDTQ